MALSNCQLCGVLFLQDRMKIRFCKDCNEQYEQQFRAFKNLLLENPGTSIQEAAVKTNVSSKLIMEWVREGRVHLS
jgi:hypothetical protein